MRIKHESKTQSIYSDANPKIRQSIRFSPYGLPVSTVPGPCDPEDLIDGIIFAANYLGSTQLLSERTPTKSARMHQAQEAMSRVRVRTHTHTHRPDAVSLVD